MALMGERSDRENILGENNGDDDSQNLWTKILSEVQSGSSTKLPTNKSLLVLGENETGKTTLVGRLQGTKEPKKGAGLEYAYIDVKDEYRDDSTRLGAWILDGDPYFTGLLKFSLSEETFDKTVVLLVASMAQPWSIIESLEKWATLLQDYINRLRISPEKMKKYEDNLVRHFQEYLEPDESSSLVTPPRRHGTGSEDANVLLPLSENTLTHNIGIPIVVVITKTDAISQLEKEHDYREEHFDFIQQHIRKFCLKHGASLCYTSVKEDKNCDLVLKYLLHRIYNFPFKSGALVVERDSVFIPAGWDNEKKISILYESMTNMKPDDAFEDVIVKPITRKPIQRDADVTAEDEQVFLMKQQSQLSKQPAQADRKQQDSPMRPGMMQRGTPSPRPTAPVAAQSPKKPMDPNKPGATNEGVLANFFNSLLSKKTGAAGAPGGPSPGARPPDRSAMTRDAAAQELERMTSRTAGRPQSASSTASALTNSNSTNPPSGS